MTLASATGLALMRHTRAPRERILAFRDRHLRRVIEHAYASVTFYRELFDRYGIRPEDIRSAAELARLPVTTKADLQRRPTAHLVARDVDASKLLVRLTGGSSGEPLVVRRSPGEEWVLNVARYRSGWYHGYDMRRPLAFVSAPRETDGPRRGLTWHACRLLGVLQAHHVSCLSPVEDILDALGRIRPSLLGGYPGVLARVARLALETGRDDIRPACVETGSETRTAEMRAQIAAAFLAPVYDTYGSHEFGRLASECRDTGAYHVCDDTVILEVLDADGRPVAPGERGEVVATALHSHAMPFLRYRLGDIVTRGDDTCACGAPFSTIASIQGRMVDYFHLPGGRLLHPYEIPARTMEAVRALTGGSRRHENPFPWLREYQYVQEREDRVVLRFVPAAEPPEAELRAIEAAVRALLGPGVEFETVAERRLDADANGKFRVYRSLVASPYDGVGISPARAAPAPAPVHLEPPRFDLLPSSVVTGDGRRVFAMKRVGELTAAERDRMFALLDAHYDRATRRQFEADLAEKEWVILSTEDGEVVGFSTLMRIRADIDGEPVLAFYSGDTIARTDRRAPVARGGITLFVRHLFAHVAAFPGLRHCYFHVAGTHRGYLMMPGIFHVSRPRHDQPMTPDARRILGALTRVKHLEYDAARSIVRYPDPTILRAGVAELSDSELRNPHVRFYVEQNPGFSCGERLASLVELAPDNLTPVARRMLGDAVAPVAT